MKEEREARVRREQEFYAKCGELLHKDHTYRPPNFRRTRWNNRKPGNGRYEGFGLIRYHNETQIYIVSRKGTKMFKSENEVYEFLRTVNALDHNYE